MDNYSEQSGWVCPRDESINYGATCSICGGSRPAPTIKVRDHCPSCGKAIPIGAESCPNCGWGTTTRWLCPHCGTANENDRVTCKNCQQPHGLPPAPALHRNGGMLAWSIVVAILFSRIAGIVAITKTNKANQSTSRAEELKHLHSAKVWNIVGCVIGVLFFTGSLANGSLLGASDASPANNSNASNNHAIESAVNTTDTIIPASERAVSVVCKELDDELSVQSEYDGNGDLIREVYINTEDDGSTSYTDIYYDEAGREDVRSFYHSRDFSQSIYVYDDSGRQVIYDTYSEGVLRQEFTYDYSRGDDEIIVSCYDGNMNLLGTVVYSDEGFTEDNWNIDNSQEISILKACIIASLL